MINRKIEIEQVQNGFVVDGNDHPYDKRHVFTTIKEVVDYLAEVFNDDDEEYEEC